MLIPITDGYRPPSNPPVPGGSKVEVSEEYTLSGGKDRFEVGQLLLTVDRATGALGQLTVSGFPVMLELPQLHVLLTSDPLRPLPPRNSWRLSSYRTDSIGGNSRILLSGSYEGFDGRFEIVLSPSGELQIASECTRTGPDIYCREVGLRFSVPLSCDYMQWRPNTGFPPDERPYEYREHARPFVQLEKGGKPSWFYEDDYSPMGSNRFRSTKFRIDNATIGYDKNLTADPHYPPIYGPAVQILSDGTQHLRAMVEPDRISVHVNDFYGGTGAGLWEWEHNYGKGKLIKKGDVLKSRLRLRLVGG